jgi:hypothetical protein
MDSEELRSERIAPSISEIPERLTSYWRQHKNASRRGQLDSNWNDRGGIYDSSPSLSHLPESLGTVRPHKVKGTFVLTLAQSLSVCSILVADKGIVACILLFWKGFPATRRGLPVRFQGQVKAQQNRLSSQLPICFLVCWKLGNVR